MKKVEALRLFKSTLPVGQWFDYWTLQQMWSEFVDSLHRDGRITDYQYNNWGNQSQYGRSVCLLNNGRWWYG